MMNLMFIRKHCPAPGQVQGNTGRIQVMVLLAFLLSLAGSVFAHGVAEGNKVFFQ